MGSAALMNNDRELVDCRLWAVVHEYTLSLAKGTFVLFFRDKVSESWLLR